MSLAKAYNTTENDENELLRLRLSEPRNPHVILGNRCFRSEQLRWDATRDVDPFWLETGDWFQM